MTFTDQLNRSVSRAVKPDLKANINRLVDSEDFQSALELVSFAPVVGSRGEATLDPPIEPPA